MANKETIVLVDRKICDNLMQDRDKWNQVYSIALEIPNIARDVGLLENELVFIGGLACYFHLRSAFGMREQKWRGTVDIDVVAFGSGSVQRMIEGFKKSAWYSKVKTRKSHLDDKVSCSLSVNNWPGSQIEIDLYGDRGEHTGREKEKFSSINLNGLNLSMDKIVNYPPQKITQGETSFYCPDIRDLILLKWVVLTGASSFRPKDVCDLIGCLAVAEKIGIKASDIYTLITSHVYGSSYRKRTLTGFSSIFDNYSNISGTREEKNKWPGVLPSKRYINNLRNSVLLN